ncbi:SpaA isopeptide-forming pilin-related protein [Ornithinibacillus scapharcae]|uniref:SpaA isopeptide-forming pilin-related protein n=1 Tax=Ornithinibacillus scapharcae TaxID=1147159 RepID=UPI000225BD48|nr:SpaA isopeptide-forming pilin-related protein [Ornithinibacillus scapharcae]
MKRKLYILLAFILILETILPAFSFQGKVLANDAGVIRSVSVVDTNGDVFTEDGASEAIVRVAWSVQDVNVEPGEIYTAIVPETVSIEQPQNGTLTFDDVEVGSYVVTENSSIINVHFNESILDKKSANGVFDVAAVHPAQLNVSLEEKQNPSQQAAIDDEVTKQETAEPTPVSEEEGDESSSEEPQIIPENILTGYGLEFEKNNESTDVVDKETLIGITYTWALANGHPYRGGAVFTFQLPQQLKVYNEVIRQEMYFNNEVIGYLTVNMNGIATIEFTDVITNYSNINGDLEVWTEIDSETIIEDGQIIITPIEGKESATIPVNFHPGGPSIEKKGIPNRVYNGETITWTIDFNKDLKTLTGVQLIDLIQNGQELKEGSIKLFKLKTKWNGSVELGEEVSANQIGTEDFTLNLGNINSAYRVVYETNITDQDMTKFSNRATMSAKDQADSSATAEVTIQRGKPLEKEAKNYNGLEQSIEWEIRYNYNEKNIAQGQAFLKDFFTDSQELVEGSITVKEVTIDPETGRVTGESPFTNYTVEKKTQEGKNGFELSFNQSINKAYKITYKTTSIDRVYTEEEIKNEVASGTHDVWVGAGRKISPQILFKSHGTPDYAGKEIGWTIRVNRDQHEMDDVIIKDTFTNGGLIFKPNTLEVTEGGVKLSANEDYEVVEDADGFTISFNKTIKKEIVIQYKTEFDYDARSNKELNFLENKVDMTWKDTRGQERNLSARAAFTPDDYTQSNGFKNGSYNAVSKEITWNVGINYNLKTLGKAVVEDTILGNQKLVTDSLVVYKMSLTGGSNGVELGEAVEGEDYEISYPTENSFRIEFKNSINTPYKIEYKTSVDGVDLVAKEYKNTATLLDAENKVTELSATVTTPFGGQYIDKSGVQKGKVIDWKIDINFAESDVEEAKITDTLDEHQVLIHDSLQLYEARVVGNGKVEKGNELEKGTDYEVTFTENPDSFTLVFNTKVDKPYILEYQTRIIAAAGTNVKNEAEFSGKNIVTQAPSSKLIEIKRTGGAGSGTGELGNLTVVKKDAADGKLLPGATFSLIDPESGAILATKITDENGKVFFDRLLYGDYILREVLAPEGYVGIADRDVTIDQPFEADNEEKPGNVETVENKKIIYAVQLKKVDEEDLALEGAVFSLEKKSGDSYETVQTNLITNETGVVEVHNLEPGVYRFIETTAPAGYQLDDTPINFTIGEKNTEMVKVRAVNLKTGSVLLRKVDERNPLIVLEGAEFKLLDSKGTELQSGLRTNENGEIIISDLQPGTYQLIETKAPFGYILDSTPKEFTMEKGKSDTVQISFENEIQLGAVQLTKIDFLDSTKVLGDVTFSLQDENGTELSQHQTDENGQIILNNLVPGDYQFLEVEAPVGYETDKTPIKFTIEKGQTEILQLTVENKAKGHVIITKVDSKNNKPLSGAEFNLQNLEGHVILTNLVTDDEGKIEINHLAPGNYKLVETKAPRGYRKLTEPVEFEITVDQKETLEIVVKNTKAPTGGGGITPPENPEDPGTPNDPSDPDKPGEPPVDPSNPNKPGEPPVDPSDPGKPGEPPVDPNKPGNPTDPPSGPDQPNKPSTPSQGGNGGGTQKDPSKNPSNGNQLTGGKNGSVSGDEDSGLSKLPQTGQNKYQYMILLGLLSIIMGAYVLRRQPKSEV